MKIRNKISLGVLIFIFIVFAALRLYIHPARIFSYDVFGYYLYLPSLVIYDDPGLNDIGWINKINDQYQATPTLYQISQTGDGNWVIRFYSGIAVMYAPFFFAGHIFALSSSYPADGFSPPYQWAIIISGIFYTLLGVWLTRKLLLGFFTDRITAITLFLLFIGSSLFFFSTLGNDAPHIYVFTLLAALLYMTHRWHLSHRWTTAAAIGLLTGLITICRPSGALAVLIPVVWGIYDMDSFKEKIRLFRSHTRHVVAFILGGILAVSPQIIYWLASTGQFFYNAYDDPQSGLSFFYPRILYVLFGFRKGLYLYSSMMIFATIGFYYLYKNNRKIFLSVLLFFLSNVYIISCYSSLVSFGWRAFIESHAVLAIPLGYFVSAMAGKGKILKYSIFFLMLCITSINLLKTYQLSIGVIDGSRMTRAYYLKTFFSFKSTKEDRELLLVERSVTNKDDFKNKEDYQEKINMVMGFENLEDKHNTRYEDSIVYSGRFSFKLDSVNVFSPPLRMPFRNITSQDHAWIQVGVYIYPTSLDDLDKALLVVDFKHRKGIYKYRAFSFKDFNLEVKPGQWNLLSFNYLTPEVRSGSDLLEVYVWYRGKSPCYIDEMRVIAFDKKVR